MLENVSEDGEELSGCLGETPGNPGEGWGGLPDVGTALPPSTLALRTRQRSRMGLLCWGTWLRAGLTAGKRGRESAECRGLEPLPEGNETTLPALP